MEKQAVNGKWSMRRQRLLRAEVEHFRRLAPLVTDPREQREILKMADTSEERLHELEKRGMPDDSAAKRTCLTGAGYYRAGASGTSKPLKISPDLHNAGGHTRGPRRHD